MRAPDLPARPGPGPAAVLVPVGEPVEAPGTGSSNVNGSRPCTIRRAAGGAADAPTPSATGAADRPVSRTGPRTDAVIASRIGRYPVHRHRLPSIVRSSPGRSSAPSVAAVPALPGGTKPHRDRKSGGKG